MLKTNVIYNCNCIEGMKNIPDNSVDAVVTDPPYGISFHGKAWDTFESNVEYAKWVEEWAKECYRILKQGGHIIAFSGTKTYHALAWGIESAGFEIRDMIEWLYLTGFPKSMELGKQFDKKYGAKREVIGTQKGFGMTKANVEQGAQGRETWEWEKVSNEPVTDIAKQWNDWGTALKPAHEPMVMARKPFKGSVRDNVEKTGTGAINVGACRIGEDERYPANCVTLDENSWYNTHFNITTQEISKKANKKEKGKENTHPTVKPLALMSWLVNLITPPNGIVVDPFAGSGSTLVSAQNGGFQFIGFEIEKEYVEIINKRLSSEI